jgi:hypothetical protein
MQIGFCQEALLDPAGARESYSAALKAADVDTATRIAAEARLRELERPVPSSATAPAGSLSAATTSKKTRGSAWGIVAGVAGATALVSAVVIVLVAARSSSGRVELPSADYGPFMLGGW